MKATIEPRKPRTSVIRPAGILTMASICLALVIALIATHRSYGQPPAVTKLTPDDYVEIYQLYSAYSMALDTGNGAGRVATFTPDGTFSWFQSKHVPETMDTVLKRTNAYGQKKRPVGGHLLTNIHITPTAEGVDATCYAILGGPDADGNIEISPGFYTDTLVKTSEGWRFKTREFWTASEEAKALAAAKAK
jgi:hypothetical protein